MTKFSKLPAGTSAHHPVIAALCAEMAEAAYLSEFDIWERVQAMGAISIRLFEEDGSQAYLIIFDNCSVLAFRGTSEPRDFLADVKARTELDVGVPVHRGFKGALDVFWGSISAAMVSTSARGPLYLTGHSLGAALSTLAAYRQPQTVTAVYTFGSPRVGKKGFVRALRNVEIHRYINGPDAVAWMAPPSGPIFGYLSVGTPRYIDRKGEVWRAPPSWKVMIDRGLRLISFRMNLLECHKMEYYRAACVSAMEHR